MSEERYRAPEGNGKETSVPLVNAPGQLYPPAMEPRHQRHPSSSSYTAPDRPSSTAVVMSQPTGPIAVPSQFARYRYEPVMVVCQFCNATVTTAVNDVRGPLQYILTAWLCCAGCWLGCCLLPLFINDLHDVEHSCANCRQIVGKFKHMRC